MADYSEYKQIAETVAFKLNRPEWRDDLKSIALLAMVQSDSEDRRLLYRAAMCDCIDFLRKQRPVERVVVSEARETDITEFMELLDEETRQIISLRMEERGLEEIARLLGITKRIVEYRIIQTRSKWRKYVEGRIPNEGETY